MGNIKQSHSKEFGSADKMEFAVSSFREIKGRLKEYIIDLTQIVSVRAEIFIDTDNAFESLILSKCRNEAMSRLRIMVSHEQIAFYSFQSHISKLTYSIFGNTHPSDKIFIVTSDAYHIFWVVNNSYAGIQSAAETNSKEIAKTIWKEWLENVAIL